MLWVFISENIFDYLSLNMDEFLKNWFFSVFEEKLKENISEMRWCTILILKYVPNASIIWMYNSVYCAKKCHASNEKRNE